MNSATTGAARCPLCGERPIGGATHAHGRDYFDCGVCGLTFMAPAQRPSAAAERARYETHENDPADAGYRAFLNRLCAPLVERLPNGASGLDYGSGPGPTLSVMLEEDGFAMSTYDPFFASDPAMLERTYDFITCTETAEHFFDPAAEFQRLDRMLRPGGLLGIMTSMRPDDVALKDWWYARDPTHVCFYRRRTMDWIGARYGWASERPHANVTLFRTIQNA